MHSFHEIKNREISSEESGGIFAKFCTSENFPLYGMQLLPANTWPLTPICDLLITRGGRTRSHAAIIADVAFISLRRFHCEQKHVVASNGGVFRTVVEVVCEVQAIYL